VSKLRAILALRRYRRFAIAVAAGYLVLFLLALGDISAGGHGFEVLTTEWTRMIERTGGLTFEPIARLTLPGMTILISPVNVAVGLLLAVLAALNLTVTYLAFRQPRACRFNRSTGIMASLPALLAGSACCAPTIVLILGLQLSSLFITIFQVLIPISVALLLVTLALILRRTDPEAAAM
jgi:flagellar biosynthesis protein FliR